MKTLATITALMVWTFAAAVYGQVGLQGQIGAPGGQIGVQGQVDTQIRSNDRYREMRNDSRQGTVDRRDSSEFDSRRNDWDPNRNRSESDGWRMVFNNGEWWYWMPNETWIYWRDGRWHAYNASSFRRSQSYIYYSSPPNYDGPYYYFDGGRYYYQDAGRSYYYGNDRWNNRDGDGWRDGYRSGPGVDVRVPGVGGARIQLR